MTGAGGGKDDGNYSMIRTINGGGVWLNKHFSVGGIGGSLAGR
jgi:hypothetical protein